MADDIEKQQIEVVAKALEDLWRTSRDSFDPSALAQASARAAIAALRQADGGHIRVTSDAPGFVTIAVRAPGASEESSLTIPWHDWEQLKNLQQSRPTVQVSEVQH